MSFFDAESPACETLTCPQNVEVVVVPRTVDLGGFSVSRVLPSQKRRMVGPFVFWDQFGRNSFLSGSGIDVRPHPHIGLATLTYLFEGSILHRDSLGSKQLIQPGDVNLMVAGSGIVHSERTSQEVRQYPHTLFGLQIWLALPENKQEINASFHHHTAGILPIVDDDGIRLRVIAGDFEGQKSVVRTIADALLVDVHLEARKQLQFSKHTEERAIHVVSGKVQIGQQIHCDGHMLVLKPGHTVTVAAESDARIVLLGGASLDGPRHVWWNFVSSSMERIRQAKQDWLNGNFGKVPGDEKESIPLPKG